MILGSADSNARQSAACFANYLFRLSQNRRDDVAKVVLRSRERFVGGQSVLAILPRPCDPRCLQCDQFFAHDLLLNGPAFCGAGA